MRNYICVMAAVFAVLIAASVASAQTPHSASTAALDAAVAQRVQASQADRLAVERLLERADVKAVAQGAGIDIRAVSAAAAALDARQMAQVAEQARSIDQSLVGGQSKVTINTTLLIVGLLVLILIIVAVK